MLGVVRPPTSFAPWLLGISVARGVRIAELEQKAFELLQKATLLDLVNDAIFVRCAEAESSYWNEGSRTAVWVEKRKASGQVTGSSDSANCHSWSMIECFNDLDESSILTSDS
jgi:hypothetical protein